MKGMIFVELMNFMDESFGADFTERVIEQADLPNEAAFTTVGNYPSEHAGALVEAASLLADADAAGLCEAFGRYLFQRFEVRFPHLLHRYASARELLDHVQSHIHEEVKVIYPGATPPSVTTHECEGDTSLPTAPIAPSRTSPSVWFSSASFSIVSIVAWSGVPTACRIMRASSFVQGQTAMQYE